MALAKSARIPKYTPVDTRQLPDCSAADMQPAIEQPRADAWVRELSAGSDTGSKPTPAKKAAAVSPAISDCFPTYASTRPPSEMGSDWGSDSETEDESCGSGLGHRLAGIIGHDDGEVRARTPAKSIHSWCVVSGRIAGIFRDAAAEEDDLAAERDRWHPVGVRLARVFADASSAAEWK